MTDGGIKINLKDFQEVHDKCEGCDKILNDKELGYMRCQAYVNPTYWWSNGRECPLVSKGTISLHDVVKRAIGEGVITKDGPYFMYNHQGLSSSINGVIGALKRNRSMCNDIKRKLGIAIDSEQGKVRVGQQKQKKKKR